MAKPQGTMRMSPGRSVTGPATAAARSNPAACAVMRVGKGRPAPDGSRLTLTVIGAGALVTATGLSADRVRSREWPVASRPASFARGRKSGACHGGHGRWRRGRWRDTLTAPHLRKTHDAH